MIVHVLIIRISKKIGDPLDPGKHEMSDKNSEAPLKE